MAHEIENEQIAYANEVPWHGIGAQMNDTDTPEEFLKAAKLDWEVNPYPLMAKMEDGTEIEVPNKFALVRSTDRKVMTVASEAWKPLQNATVVDFMKRYTQAGGAKMETVGALRDGAVVWCLARINHSFEVRPGDKVAGYLLITAPHIVGVSIKIQTTTVRVVCANTMALAERDAAVHYRQSHLLDFDVDSARNAVAEAHVQLEQAERRAKILDKLKLTAQDAVTKVLVPTFAPDMLENEEAMAAIMEPSVMGKKLSSLLESIEHGPGATPETGWGVLNGVTHWCDHVAGKTNSSRLWRSWVGDYGRAKVEVQERLMELADAE